MIFIKDPMDLIGRNPIDFLYLINFLPYMLSRIRFILFLRIPMEFLTMVGNYSSLSLGFPSYG